MRFKQAGLEVELWMAHPKAVALALYADAWATRNLGHDLVVTDVGRTQAEYDRIYAAKILEGQYFIGADGEKHYAGPRPHLADPLHGVPSHAIDFRTIGEMPEPEIRRLVDHLNATFQRNDGKPTAIYHDIGGGQHVHCQALV